MDGTEAYEPLVSDLEFARLQLARHGISPTADDLRVIAAVSADLRAGIAELSRRGDHSGRLDLTVDLSPDERSEEPT